MGEVITLVVTCCRRIGHESTCYGVAYRVTKSAASSGLDWKDDQIDAEFEIVERVNERHPYDPRTLRRSTVSGPGSNVEDGFATRLAVG